MYTVRVVAGLDDFVMIIAATFLWLQMVPLHIKQPNDDKHKN